MRGEPTMRIAYLWIDKFRGLENQEINFPGPCRFSYDSRYNILTQTAQPFPNLLEDPRHPNDYAIRDLAILVGPNGSGKSSVLQALLHLVSWAGTINDKVLSGPFPFGPQKSKAIFILEDEHSVDAFGLFFPLPSTPPVPPGDDGFPRLKHSRSTLPTKPVRWLKGEEALDTFRNDWHRKLFALHYNFTLEATGIWDKGWDRGYKHQAWENDNIHLYPNKSGGMINLHAIKDDVGRGMLYFALAARRQKKKDFKESDGLCARLCNEMDFAPEVIDINRSPPPEHYTLESLNLVMVELMFENQMAAFLGKSQKEMRQIRDQFTVSLIQAARLRHGETDWQKVNGFQRLLHLLTEIGRHVNSVLLEKLGEIFHEPNTLFGWLKAHSSSQGDFSVLSETVQAFRDDKDVPLSLEDDKRFEEMIQGTVERFRDKDVQEAVTQAFKNNADFPNGFEASSFLRGWRQGWFWEDLPLVMEEYAGSGLDPDFKSFHDPSATLRFKLDVLLELSPSGSDLRDPPQGLLPILEMMLSSVPPWFTVDYKEGGDKGWRSFQSLSGGERTLLTQFILMPLHLKDLQDARPPWPGQGDLSVLLLLDEVETALHPRWQRKYLDILVRNLKINGVQLQVILSTHSPFVVTDLPAQHYHFFTVNAERPPEKTFFANIHDLFKEGFFLDRPISGALAEREMKGAFKFFRKASLILDDAKEMPPEERERWFLDQIGLSNVEQLNQTLKRYRLIQDACADPYMANMLKNELGWFEERFRDLSPDDSGEAAS
ncbi:MAG: AAA family ATPase [Magnetococcales bacterium]|nr:AAA family ATPase [Magnetococcales bacterium]